MLPKKREVEREADPGEERWSRSWSWLLVAVILVVS
jgi:rhamnogalacturonyl hydrolase YesR